MGTLRQVKYLLAILVVIDGQSFAQVAVVLRVHEKTRRRMDTRVLLLWEHRARRVQKPTGRPPKLTPT